MAYEYKIGVDIESLALLQTLGVRFPLDEPLEFPEQRTLSGGNVIGLGFAQATWHWTVISEAEYGILRNYCSSPGLSANIAIRTYDSERQWVDYLGKIIWPVRRNFTAGRILDFTL